MAYKNLRQCVDDLLRSGRMVQIDEPVDANLEAAEIHRRVFDAGGPAVYYGNVKDCQFPMVSNLFGTMERTRYIFRDTLDQVTRLVELKADPQECVKSLGRNFKAAWAGTKMLPRCSRRGPILECQTTVKKLPQLKSWPKDGGAFVTLPLVYTEHVATSGWRGSNLGMYRVQLSGGQYVPDEEIGLHYQLHRGIGVHHEAAIRRGKPFRVNVFVGGAPAMSVAAVMPLPEGFSELSFAGALAGHRIPMIQLPDRLPIYAEADFCISGTVDPDRLLPEGPFGDHLGYYSLAHDFPVMRVDRVYHRKEAIWPFTVVGRPPQEDTVFGALIHEITAPMIPTVVVGVRAVHAVDAAGVHPLMLAIGSERYVPYEDRSLPREVLTQANAILGQGQMSLAKYLFIVAGEDDPTLPVEDIESYFAHVLCRIDWRRDLHFHTCTTIDTLDYSGTSLNHGSKVVLAAVGQRVRELPASIDEPIDLPAGFSEPRVCLPGVLAIQAPPAQPDPPADSQTLGTFCQHFRARSGINRFPLIVLADDSQFTSQTLRNFLWVTFTRSDPARDIDGIEPFIEDKHWGCRGSLVVDARRKVHHAPPLEPDPEVSRRVDALAAKGLPISKWL